MAHMSRMDSGFSLMELLTVIAVITVLAAMGIPGYLAIKRHAMSQATQVLVHDVMMEIRKYDLQIFSWPNPHPPAATDLTALPSVPMIQARMWNLNGTGTIDDNGNVNGPDCLINAHNPSAGRRFDSLDGTPATTALTDDSVSMGGSGLTTTTQEPKVQRDGTGIAADGGPVNNAFPQGAVQAGYRGFYDMVQPNISPHFLNARHQIIDSWGQPLRIAIAQRTYGKDWCGIWSPGPDMIDSTADDLTSWGNNGTN